MNIEKLSKILKVTGGLMSIGIACVQFISELKRPENEMEEMVRKEVAKALGQ